MRSLKELAPRAAIGFAFVIALVVAVVVASALLAERASAQRERALVGYADDLTSASRAQVAAERMIASGRGYLLTREPELLTRARAAEADLDAALATLTRRAASLSERRLLPEVRRSATRYFNLLDEFLSSTADGTDQQRVAAVFRDKLLPARKDLEIRIQDLVADKTRLRDEGRASVRRTVSWAFAGILAIGSAGVLLAASLALISTRRLALLYRNEQDAARRARLAAQTTEDLVGVVAHDLRNPLSVIVTSARIIRRRTDNPEIARHAERLNDVAARMEHFIGGLLDAAAIEGGGFSVVREESSASDLVNQVIDMRRGAAKEKNIGLRWQIERATKLWVDPERLHQVLSNLLDNAIKFTPENGTVELRVVDASPMTRFEVRDSGPGIPRPDATKVFERYWKSRAGGTKGVGLGLYIAKGIVECHGGRIWVDTTLGPGATFIFEIPTLAPLGAAIRPQQARIARQDQPSTPETRPT